MGCQKSIASKIREKKADYVLSLKRNHGNLYDAVTSYFKGVSKKELEIDEECGKGHGRVDVRSCSVCWDINWLTEKEKWEGLNCIIEVESLRIEGKKDSKKKWL